MDRAISFLYCGNPPHAPQQEGNIAMSIDALLMLIGFVVSTAAVLKALQPVRRSDPFYI